MIERIDLFMPPRSRYQVLHLFTQNLAAALGRVGIRCRILEAQRENPKEFIDTLLKDPPECTLSFNGLLPDEEGHFFCDMIRIPHLACLVDAPQHFLSLTHTPYSIISCVDRFACDFFQGINFQNVLFMPHGVDRDLILPMDNSERPYDVLMLASYIDYEEILENWKKAFPSKFCDVLIEAAEMTLSDRSISNVQALAKSLDTYAKAIGGFDPTKVDFLTLIDQLEDYINGKDRVMLLKSIKDASIHIFGAGSHRWGQALGHMPNIMTHEPVSYEQAITLMRKSKIVLNSCPSITYGTHERILSGLASGAAVLTNENIYMQDFFTHRQNILFYRYGRWDEVNALVNDFLTNASLRTSLVNEGQHIVRNHHTWDQRAANLISELSPIVQKINYSP